MDQSINSLADELRSLEVIMVSIAVDELSDVEVPSDEVKAEPVDPPADLILKVLADYDSSHGRKLVVTTITGLITMSFMSSFSSLENFQKWKKN